MKFRGRVEGNVGRAAPGIVGNETMGDIEAAVVTYCTSNKHGTRTIVGGAITAVQVRRVRVSGFDRY